MHGHRILIPPIGYVKSDMFNKFVMQEFLSFGICRTACEVFNYYLYETWQDSYLYL